MWEEHSLPDVQLYLSLPDRDLATPELRTAWQEFYDMTSAIVFATVWRIRPARPMAEDVIQDVFARLMKSLLRFRLDPARGDFEGWLKSIACHEAWRRVRKREKRQESPIDSEVVNGVLDPNQGPDAELERIQEHELFKMLITEFITRLPERDRRVVAMKFLSQLSVPEIAHESGLTENCAWLVLHRVIPTLRDFLRARGLE